MNINTATRLPPSAARPWIVLLAALFFPLLLWSLIDMRIHLAPSAATPGGAAAYTLRKVQIALGLCLAIALAFRARQAQLPVLLGPLRSGFHLRLWLYCVLAGALGPTIATAAGRMAAANVFAGSMMWSCVLIGWAIWIAIIFKVTAFTWVTERALPRLIEISLFNLVVLVLLGEVLIAGVQRFSPSPLIWDDSSAEAMVNQLRGVDSTAFRRYNSRGFPDKEFFERGPDDYTVAVVTDSFGVGSVPYKYNFATVAERELQKSLGSQYDRVAVDNYGIVIINMPEYLHLLSTEVIAANPDQIVLAVFVGNDIGGQRPNRERDRSRLQNWLVVQTLDRVHSALTGVRTIDIRWRRGVDTLAQDPPFVHDSSLEKPYFTEQAYLKVEGERLEVCNTESDATTQRYAEFFEALLLAKEWVGPNLLVMVIPDEFQVNDGLYKKLIALQEDPQNFDRDHPQNQIVAWGRRHGVRVLDLLPLLREAEPAGHTYHLRDTHWNARGNRVAGEALAAELMAY